MIQGYRSIPDLDALHQDQHRLLFANCLGVIEKVFTTVPTADNIPSGYAAIYESGSMRRIYFNINGTIVYIITGSATVYASTGANTDITSLAGLTTPLSVAQGGTGETTSPLPVAKGGTGSTAAANAANGVVVLNASSQLPAVSGALLTNISVAGIKIGQIIPGGLGLINMSANDAHASRYMCHYTTTITRLGIQWAGVTAGANIVLGIYTDASDLPNVKLGQTAEYTIVAADADNETTLALTSSVNLTAGTQYWLVVHSDVGLSVERFAGRARRNIFKTFTYSSTLPSSFGAKTGDIAGLVCMAGF